MKKLDEKSWACLSAFGDDSALHIESTSSSIDAVRLIDEEEKTVPYITRSDMTNGTTRFVGAKNYSYGSDEAGCITVGLDTQTAFYQPYRFVTGQNIQIVTGDDLNEDNALFLTTILRQQMSAKFNWGGNGATLGRMKDLSVMFPITESGEPDYRYMTDYVRDKRKMLLTKYRDYVAERIEEIGETTEIAEVDEKDWSHFKIPEVFNFIQRGKRLKKADHVAGAVPYVSSTANNNGVDGYIKAVAGARVFGDCISLANSGSVGTAFYEPFNFVASDHITALKKDGTSKYVYLFLAAAIRRQSANFNFNREINDSRIQNMQIVLPVNKEGKPDFEYMKQYAKNLMLKKYRQYLSFLDRKTEQASDV